MTINISYFDGPNRTPAIPLIARCWHELIEANLILPVIPFGYDNHVLVAAEDGKPVGFITWNKAEWSKTAYICLGYVLPEYRGKGIYRQLWNALVEKAREQKLISIEGNTAIKNQAMRGSMLALGRTERGVIATFDIPPISTVTPE